MSRRAKDRHRRLVARLQAAPVTPAAPADPPAQGDLLFWGKADAGTFQDSGRTTPASADDDPVGGWADQSAAGNHLEQTVDDLLRLTLKTNRQNGRPAVYNPGTQNFLEKTIAALDLAGAFTLALAWKRLGTNGQERFFGVNGHDALYRSGTALRCRAGSSALNYAEASFTSTDFVIHLVRFDGSQATNETRLRRWLNGTEETLSYTGTVPATESATGRFTVGHAAIGGDIDVGEALLWGKALSAQEIADAFSYLNGRWAAY